MSSRQRGLEQERSKQAWDCVKAVKQRDNKFAKEYGALARSLSADLQTNGLGQTLAFLRAKGFEQGRASGDKAHGLLYSHVGAWVIGQMSLETQDLLKWVTDSASGADYRRAAAEAMAFAAWLKRFAEAELPTGGDDGH